MPACNKCGTKYSVWSARADHFCKSCGAEADAIAKAEKDRKEAERKQRVFEESERNIALILNGISTEKPLAFTFINRNITTQNSSNTTGVVVGGLMFGIVGAMIGGAMAGGGSTKHSGEMGVLVVTQTQVIIGCITTAFPSADGKISSEHLTLFRDQMSAGKVIRKTFNIRQTQLLQSAANVNQPSHDGGVSLKCLGQAYSCRKSDLYINGLPYALTGTNEIRAVIKQLDPLVTPTEFVTMLERGGCPISSERFAEVKSDNTYFNDIFEKIENHPDRSTLVRNFSCLIPPLRDQLETRITQKGAGAGRLKVKLAVCASLAIMGGICLVTTQDFLQFLSGALVVITTIMSINTAVNLRRAIVCRDLLTNAPRGALPAAYGTNSERTSATGKL